MSRPFSLTLQAHALELHRAWLGSLALATAVMLVWAWWGVAGQLPIREHSARVEVGALAPGRLVVETRGNTERIHMVRQRRLTADFSAAAGARIRPGQAAVVRTGSGARLAAVVVDVERDSAGARVRLDAALPEDEPDPLGPAETAEVDVTIGTTSPLGHFLSGRAGGAPDSADRGSSG